MNWFKKLKIWPVFLGLILFLVLAMIWSRSIDPQQALIGWDNFSISLNIPINIFRTFFSSWRAYRGLGVPSDSESVDIFRAILQRGLNLALSSNLIDQIYYLGLYTLGVLGCFCLAFELVKGRFLQNKDSHSWPIIGGLFGALAYAFNFHVLETFFLPVAMYPARYAFFPFVLFFFVRLLNAKTFRFKDVIPFVIVNLLASTAYLTATVFITLEIILIWIGIVHLNRWIKIFFLSLSVVLLNSFWVFPFANYTLQKASLLPEASSFTSVNESVLNKPASNFSWQNLLTYYPLTMTQKALPFSELKNDQSSQVLQDLVLRGTLSPKASFLIFLPAFLAAIGILALLKKSFQVRNTYALWPIGLVVTSLFLLRKELAPLGFLYQLIEDHVPFFNIVFRFGGAKFYPLLLISMSMLSAIGATWVLQNVQNVSKNKVGLFTSYVVGGVLSLAILAPFASFLSEGLFSSLVKVHFPPAYYQLASSINSDQSKGRVLQLPVDQFSYWRSYHWGYFGSTFLSFMLSKPTLDRTFEPASLENDFYFQELQNQVFNSPQVVSSDLVHRVNRVNRLFNITGTKYILFDQSISADLLPENVKAWGVFHQSEYGAFLKQMAQANQLSATSQFVLPNDPDKLQLYKTQEEVKEAQFLSSAINVDPEMKDGFTQPLLEFSEPIIQTATRPFVSFPLWQPRHQLRIDDKNLTLSVPLQHTDKLTFELPATGSARAYYDVYAQRETDSLKIYLQARTLPLAFTFQPELAQKLVFAQPKIAEKVLALSLGKQTVSLPAVGDDKLTFLGSYLLANTDKAVVLEKTTDTTIELNKIALTQDPNCYRDRKDGYQFTLNAALTDLQLSTQNGMTCLSIPLEASHSGKISTSSAATYFKTQFVFNTITKPLSAQAFHLAGSTAFQNKIRQFIDKLTDYSMLSVCLLDPSSGKCLNQQENVRVSDPNAETELWTTQPSSKNIAQLLLILPAAAQQQSKLVLKKLQYQAFVPLAEATFSAQTAPLKTTVSLPASDHLSLEIPFAVSTALFSSRTQPLRSTATVCPAADGYQAIKIDTLGRIIAYSENCWADVYATVPVDDQLSYLWLAKYKVLAGRHPKLIVRQNDLEVTNEYVSRFNLYPNLPGFKVLQKTPLPWKNADSVISSEMSSNNYVWEGSVIDPLLLDKSSQVQFQLVQSGEDQGVLGVEEMAVLGLPKEWRNLRVETGEPRSQFAKATVTYVKSILPSLWQIDVHTENQQGELLLELGQAYDKQWQLYQTTNPWLAMVGVGIVPAEHVRTNGWSNGWIIRTDHFKQQNVTLFALYTPERLAILGWIVTTLTVLCLLGFAWFKSRSHNPINSLGLKNQ